MAKKWYRYYVAYVAQAKQGGIIFGNESVWFDEPLTIDNMEDIRECIANRKGLTLITILNVIKI